MSKKSDFQKAARISDAKREAGRRNAQAARIAELEQYKAAFKSEEPFRDRAQRLLGESDGVSHLGRTHLEGFCDEVEHLRAQLDAERAAHARVRAALAALLPMAEAVQTSRAHAASWSGHPETQALIDDAKAALSSPAPQAGKG